MRILVIGGAGRLGAEVVRQLRASGIETHAASRNPGPDGIIVDLNDVESIVAAARGYDAALLSTPLSAKETTLGLNGLKALEDAGLLKVVYIAIHNLEALAEIPHFDAKIPVKTRALESARNVVLEPNFFYQNDLFFFEAIRFGGVYPLPIGSVGVASVDIGDVAAAAVSALTRSDWDGRAVPICGPDVLTGEQLAQNWSDAIGRPIVYPGDAIPPFIEGLARALPLDDWMRNDTEVMMRVTQKLGCLPSEADHAATRAILGRPPRRHADFAKSAAATQMPPSHSQQA